MTTFKNFIRRTFLYSIFIYWRDRREYKEWEKRGRPIPPPHLIKQQTIKEYQKKFSVNTLIETGTYMGAMVFAMKDVFKQIFSIEINKELYQKAKEKFAHLQHIHIIEGNSSEILPILIASIKQPTLFWLDGHHSPGMTINGELATPIMEELRCIFNHSIKDHIILIDDAHDFIGKGDYPTIEEVKKFVLTERPNWIFEVKDNIIIVHR